MNPATNTLAACAVELAWRGALLQHPVAQYRDPIAHRHGLHLIVGDIDGGDPQPPLQFGDLVTGLHPQHGIQVRQWLVHQEDLRASYDRAAHRDSLAFTAGKILGLAPQEFGQAQQLGGFRHPGADLGLGGLGHPEGETHVLRHGHVRIQGVVLEHHGDVAMAGVGRGDVVVADVDMTGVNGFQAYQHPQRRRLAAARRPDQHHELSVGDRQIQCVQGGAVGARIAPGHRVEGH